MTLLGVGGNIIIVLLYVMLVGSGPQWELDRGWFTVFMGWEGPIPV
jgi:hypothetical protein